MSGRSGQLQIRVTPAEKAAIRAAAERCGVGISEFVLERVLPGAARRVASLVERLAHWESSAALAELIDTLQASSAVEFDAAFGLIDAGGLSPYAASYLATLTEMRARQLEVEAPSWTRAVPPLAGRPPPTTLDSPLPSAG